MFNLQVNIIFLTIKLLFLLQFQLYILTVLTDEKSSEVCIRTPKLLDISTEAVNSSPLGNA